MLYFITAMRRVPYTAGFEKQFHVEEGLFSRVYEEACQYTKDEAISELQYVQDFWPAAQIEPCAVSWNYQL